jgi:hypothetical protein
MILHYIYNEAETEKGANRILYPWYVWAIISNNITGAWFDPPSKPLPTPPRAWLGDEKSVRWGGI